MAEVRIENLHKAFGDSVAVQDLSLAVADGEFLTLLGPSGCGKTTTLRCIAGLERQSSGDIRIGHRVVNNLPPGERDVAMVFQLYALYPHLTAYENMAFPLRTQKVPKAEVDERVREAAGLLSIEHLLSRKPGKLSGGEQQRVALGRAMVRRPQVFLMDEPLTNLDPRLRTEMRVEIKRLQRTLRTTMVYVTHDQTEALSMSQRIAVMNRGVLQQVGSPLDVYNRPATLFVASAIGSPPMNLIDCELVEGEQPVLCDRTGRFEYHLPPPQHHKLETHPARQQLVYGIRPEDIQIQPGGEREGLPSEVRAREALGDGTVYDLQVGEKIFKAKTPPALRLGVGERVRLVFNPSRSHVFAAKTGAAIF
ncbi:MAG: ABC transporter ATP-binding protein [Chloroflexota bacterium]|nr:ABC transporter ATP-binding protein [Chloroflexota bacterium]